jgi:hypothetical protein
VEKNTTTIVLKETIVSGPDNQSDKKNEWLQAYECHNASDSQMPS